MVSEGATIEPVMKSLGLLSSCKDNDQEVEAFSTPITVHLRQLIALMPTSTPQFQSLPRLPSRLCDTIISSCINKVSFSLQPSSSSYDSVARTTR